MNRIIKIVSSITLLLLLLPCFCIAAPKKQYIVVIDAGHGGKDPGAIGSSSKNREKDINLGITLEVGRLLKANCSDVKLIYTRSTDVFLELGKRADIANKNKADLFISIHTNALPKEARKAAGVQSYTLCLRTASTNLEVEKRENSVIQYETDGNSKYAYSTPNSSESDIMFELMQDRDMQESVNFAKIVQGEMVNSAHRNDMGVLQANLAVLRLTYMPSVLLEVGYISTPSEEQFLLSKAGQSTMAKSIYNAIVKYKAQQTGIQSKLEKITTTSPKESNEPAITTSTKEEDSVKNVVTASTAAGKIVKDDKGSNGTTNSNSAVQQKEAVQAEAPKTIYCVQLFSGKYKLNSNDKQFKGLKCDMRQKGDIYAYTYGSASTMEEAKKIRQTVLDKFPNAFVTSFQE